MDTINLELLELQPKPPKKRVSGWLSIKDPQDMEKALTRAINKILASGDCITHAGKIASLANAW